MFKSLGEVRIHWDLSLVATLCFWLGVLVGVGWAAQPISLKVSPRQAFEHTTIRSTITVEPNYLNSAVCLIWDSADGAGGSHCWTIEGQYAAKTYTFDLHNVEAGEYEFVATVFQGPKWVRSVALTVNVISQRGE